MASEEKATPAFKSRLVKIRVEGLRARVYPEVVGWLRHLGYSVEVESEAPTGESSDSPKTEEPESHQ
jgi:hypothetical protein